MHHTWIERDRQVLIHPYTAPYNEQPLLPIEQTAGCAIKLADGPWLIDGMASWWSAIHGYNHPELIAAAKQQLDTMPHIMFGGLTHYSAIKLAEQLVEITPEGLQKVFFSDSGSVSIEVAMKMAFQYHIAKGKPRTKLLTINGGYHGDTFAAMSVCDPLNGMHSHFKGVLKQQLFAPRPHPISQSSDNSDFAAFKNILEANASDIAAVILEPILQNAGGMYRYRPGYLQQVAELCQHFDILLIADEIATGFGRIGEWFACNQAEIKPDLLCVGKALTGGMISLAATLCSERVARQLSKGDLGVLMHGPTFMANPLACSVASASLTLLSTKAWQQQVQHIERQLTERLESARSLERVVDVRIIGAVGVIELKQPLNINDITPLLLKHKVWLRPFGKLIYTMPPYIITPNELDQICDAMLALANT